MSEPTRETERQALIDQVGECCRGADPYCAGGCLREKAIRLLAQREWIDAEFATALAQAKRAERAWWLNELGLNAHCPQARRPTVKPGGAPGEGER